MGVPVPWGTCALDLVAYGERPKSVKWEFLRIVTDTDHVPAAEGQLGVAKIGDGETD